MVSVRLRRGKGDFHIRLNPDSGEKENTCLCIYNVDFSTGCLAQVPGKDLLDIVTKNNGCYPKEELLSLREAFGKIPDKRCDYCYAMRHNSGRAIPSEVDEKTLADFKEHRPEVVRLGKNTEVGYQLYRKPLVDFLELCKEFGTKIIMPTKVLEFDPLLVDLLKEVGGTIHYSIGYDKLEQGPGSQGFYNQWRIEQAEAYHQNGVNTALTILCDVTASIEENDFRGSEIKYALDSLPSLPKRILPMRLTSRYVAKIVTGYDWDDLKNPKQLTFETLEKYSPEMRERLQRTPYTQRGNNDFTPQEYHSDFQPFMDRNFSCGPIGETERCDNCLVYPESMNFSFPTEQLIKVKYASHGPNGRDGRYNGGNKKDPNSGKQKSIFDDY